MDGKVGFGKDEMLSYKQKHNSAVHNVVDGSFTNPIEAINTESAERRGQFSDFIQKAGNSLLDANKSKLFQNVEQQSETEESQTNSNDSSDE